MPISDPMQYQTRNEMRRDAWICQCNIALFAGQLAVIVDETRRATLLELIAEQQSKLADVQARRYTACSNNSMPIPVCDISIGIYPSRAASGPVSAALGLNSPELRGRP